MNLAPIDKSKLARNGEEFLALAASDADWIIRSVDDLRYVRENDKEGPFATLPEPDFNAFANSLRFNKGAVSGGSYRFLMPSLTLTQIYEVFERFGMAKQYFNEIHEWRCTAAGWKFDFWEFCPSTC
ncbi:hypothetical protein GCM10010404_61340 [Nonomuraea africana]|uniref:Uncharacterized protein n=1 Tax=Nonomuraea africana TaxID=46171 RepID=A0ABR9K6I7_9ACTN|nr:hypothetical protein [Nonomuraea africana]MBE1557631.1 hypothetical protein [Nonomuraea africana]